VTTAEPNENWKIYTIRKFKGAKTGKLYCGIRQKCCVTVFELRNASSLRKKIKFHASKASIRL